MPQPIIVHTPKIWNDLISIDQSLCSTAKLDPNVFCYIRDASLTCQISSLKLVFHNENKKIAFNALKYEFALKYACALKYGMVHTNHFTILKRKISFQCSKI